MKDNGQVGRGVCAENLRRGWRASACAAAAALSVACGHEPAWEQTLVGSQDFIRYQLLDEESCSVPPRSWDPRGEGVVQVFSDLHQRYADGPSLRPFDLRRVQILRFVSSAEMREIKGEGSTPLEQLPLGLVRHRECDRRPLEGLFSWNEMYFLDPEAEDHDPINASIMRSEENRTTVFVHESLHALGYGHFEGRDDSLSLRDGAAGSRFVISGLEGANYQRKLGESFKEAYLSRVPRTH